MDAKWRLDFADASTSGNNAPVNPPGYASLRELGVRPAPAHPAPPHPPSVDQNLESPARFDFNRVHLPRPSPETTPHPTDHLMREQDVGAPAKGKADAPKGGVVAPGGALTSAARQQKAYQFAMSQVQAIGMTGFMMYMAGSGVQIFSMMVVGNGLFQPIKAIASSGKIFEPYADASTDVTGPRALFCAIQLAGLAMALYKLNSMGLLPTHASDWVSGMKPPTPVEHAYGGTTL